MDNEYFINVGDLRNKIFAIGLGGGSGPTAGVQPVIATWAAGAATGGVGVLSTLSTNLATAGATLLKDAGRTYVSAGRAFRKVQLVVPQGTGDHKALSTFGVGGVAGSALPQQDFYTGYIEVGFEGSAAVLPTPVAKWGR
jgi:hypothetical protein